MGNLCSGSINLKNLEFSIPTHKENSIIKIQSLVKMYLARKAYKASTRIKILGTKLAPCTEANCAWITDW